MAASVNKVFLLGNLGQDPESRYLPSGTQVVKLRVATTERETRDGQKVEITVWHSCSMFGKLAEIAEKYLKKGSQVFLEGSIRPREYEARDGKHEVLELGVDRMQMLGSASEPRERAQGRARGQA